MSNWLYTYDGETERVQIGGTEIVDGDAEHIIGRLRIHTLGGDVVAIEIRPEEGSDEELEQDEPEEEEAAPVPPPVVLTPRVPEGKKGRPRKDAEDEPQPTKPTKVRRCSQCSQPGHQARTCPGVFEPAAAPEVSGLTEDEIEEIKQRRADGETTSEIAAVMELEYEQVAKVMADGRGDQTGRRAQDAESFDDKVARLVAQGCSVGDIKVAFPAASEREIEEAIAWAQR